MDKTGVEEMESDINYEIMDEKENNVESKSNSSNESIVIEAEKSDNAETSNNECETDKIESIKEYIYIF